MPSLPPPSARCSGPTSVVNEPAVVAAHRVLLLDDPHQVALHHRHVQVLRRVEVPLRPEQLLRGVARQQARALLVRLGDVVGLRDPEGIKHTVRTEQEPVA